MKDHKHNPSIWEHPFVQSVSNEAFFDLDLLHNSLLEETIKKQGEQK